MRHNEVEDKGHFAQLLKSAFEGIAGKTLHAMPHGAYPDSPKSAAERCGWSIGYYEPRAKGFFGYFAGNKWTEIAAVTDSPAVDDFTIGRDVGNYPRQISVRLVATLGESFFPCSVGVAYNPSALKRGDFHRAVAETLIMGLKSTSKNMALDW